MLLLVSYFLFLIVKRSRAFVYTAIQIKLLLLLYYKGLLSPSNNNNNYPSKQTFPSFHWPKTHHVTCKYLPTNNGLLMRNAVQLCLAANNILLMRKGNRAFLLVAIALA